MNIQFPPYTELCVRAAVTLGHFLWQGAIVAAVAILAARLAKRRSAQLRYALLLAGLLVMAACPVATFVVLGQGAEPSLAAAPQSPPAVMETPPLILPDHSAAYVAPAAFEDAAAAPADTQLAAQPAEPTPTSWAAWASWQQFAPHVTLVYLAGVAAMLARLLLALRGGQSLRRTSRPVTEADLLAAFGRAAAKIAPHFGPALAYCKHVAAPTVVGLLRPVVLLPVSIATGLSDEQIEAVLAHELAHIRRYDHLVNLAQRVIEAGLFFHPAVWLISRRVRIERENCCDDMVLAAGGEPHSYAASLVHLAASSVSSGRRAALTSAAALGATDRPSRLRARVLRLIDGPGEQPLRLRRTWPIALIILAAIIAPTCLLVNAETEPATPLTQAEPPATQPAKQPAGKATTDQVIVEDLALEILVAIREKDDAALKAMSVDRIKGWRDAWPHFSLELRERFTQMTGKPFTMYPARSIVNGDVAAVECTGPKELNGVYLVLFFVKTNSGWKNFSMRNSPPSTTLETHLPKAAKAIGVQLSASKPTPHGASTRLKKTSSSSLFGLRYTTTAELTVTPPKKVVIGRRSPGLDTRQLPVLDDRLLERVLTKIHHTQWYKEHSRDGMDVLAELRKIVTFRPTANGTTIGVAVAPPVPPSLREELAEIVYAIAEATGELAATQPAPHEASAQSATSEAGSVTISGSGRITGGTYKDVRISGSGRVTGDIIARTIVISGSANLSGNVNARKVRLSGSAVIGKNVHARELTIAGSGNIGGNMVAGKLKASGATRVKGSVKADQVTFSGRATIGKGVIATSFIASGAIEIAGRLSAKQAEIELNGHCKIREIECETLSVKKRRGRGLFGLGKAKGSLTTESIVGDDIDIEATKAKLVRGRRVKVGPGCQIDRVEYSETLDVSDEAEVKQRVKVPAHDITEKLKAFRARHKTQQRPQAGRAATPPASKTVAKESAVTDPTATRPAPQGAPAQPAGKKWPDRPREAFKFNSKARLKVYADYNVSDDSKIPHQRRIGFTPAAEDLEIPAVRTSWTLALVGKKHVGELRKLVRELNGQHGLPEFPRIWMDASTTDSDLKEVAKIAELKDLQLLACDKITDAGLAHIGNMKQLEHLGLPSSTTDAGLAEIARLGELRHLYLQQCNQITDEGLGHVGKLKKLNVLSLSSSHITDKGLGHIAGLSQLGHLLLQDCDGITDAGLARISKIAALRGLWLSDCDNITDAGLAHLARLTGLRSLQLSGNITDAGLAHIARLPKLRLLNIGEQGVISSEMASRLKAASGKLEIKRIARSPVELCSFTDALKFDKTFAVDQQARTGFHHESYTEEGTWQQAGRAHLFHGIGLDLESIRLKKSWLGKEITAKVKFGSSYNEGQFRLTVRLLDVESKVLAESSSTIDTTEDRGQWPDVLSLGKWQGDVAEATSFDLALVPLSAEGDNTSQAQPEAQPHATTPPERASRLRHEEERAEVQVNSAGGVACPALS